MPQITFWFEFASTYSYLSAMRIQDAAKNAGIDIEWKPFLLGPIFKAQGWESSPFNLYRAKGFYMVRDIERIAASRGFPFRMPVPFPQNGVQAARLALVGIEQGWGPAFVHSVYWAQFAEGLNISETETLSKALTVAGANVEDAFAQAESAEFKSRLRSNTDEAQAKGIFGAPSFLTPDGELFWGDDRLESSILWVTGPRGPVLK